MKYQRGSPKLNRFDAVTVLYLSPGIALWTTFLMAPRFLPTQGVGGGIILLPFVGCIAANGLVLTAMILVQRVNNFAKCLVLIVNLSFPAYVGVLIFVVSIRHAWRAG